MGVALSLVVGLQLQIDTHILPASCWGCDFLPWLNSTLACLLYPVQCPKCPPALGGGCPSLLAPLGGSIQVCGSWNLEQLLAYAYCCILPACWGDSSDSGPGIPLDCSPQTLGQEVAVRRARLDSRIEGGTRETMSWRYLTGGLERDNFCLCPLAVPS